MTTKVECAAYKALAKAQSEIGVVFKDAVNPHFRSRYASLSAVLASVLPALNDNGFSVTQTPDYSPDDGTVFVYTVLRHEAGHVIEGTTRGPIGKRRDIQSFGSCVTYLRRYALLAMLGIAVDDDTDGNQAAARRTPPTTAAPVNAAQWSRKIAEVLKEHGLTVKDFNVWSVAKGRKPLGAFQVSELEAAHTWLDERNGVLAIKAHVEGGEA